MIPGEFYPNKANKGDIESVGVKATLITSSEVRDEIVYAITKEVFDNLAEFKELHPAYSTLTKESMLNGLSAPVHPGALKYYMEAGLTQYIKPELMR
jgi:TRAP transporter TAXI family solute receptor